MSAGLDLALYLQSLADLYPHGVLLPTKQKPILIVDPRELETQCELLHSIIEKGMKLKVSDVEILNPQQVPSACAPEYAISFGITIPNTTPAPSLQEIATNPDSKKYFWSILKSFIGS